VKSESEVGKTIYGAL